MSVAAAARGGANPCVKAGSSCPFRLFTPRGRHSVAGSEVVPMYVLRSLRAGALVVALALMPAAAQAETLRQALESAYVNNPDLMSALLAVKSSAENIVLSKSGKLPSIGLQGTLRNEWTLSDGMSASTPSYGLNLGYEQNLFDSYKTESEIEKARAGAE